MWGQSHNKSTTTKKLTTASPVCHLTELMRQQNFQMGQPI